MHNKKTINIRKTEEFIKKIITKSVFENFTDPSLISVSIIHVDLTGDKQNAIIFVDFISKEDNKIFLLNKLNRKKNFFRSELSRKLSSRKVPFLDFKLDDLLLEINKIEKLIDKTKNNG